MKYKLQDFIDSERINLLLELFNKTTGFVTAILDLEGNVLSKSGWREICTDFHRVNSTTCKKCTESDTALAGQLAKGEKYHAYKCLNGLVDVAVPIILDGEHIGNLFTGQFLSKEPDLDFFRKQAITYGFDEATYMSALKKVPIVSEKDAKIAMDFLLNMTLLFCDMTMQKNEQRKSERLYYDLVETAQDLIWQCDAEGRYTFLNPAWESVFGYKVEEMIGKKFIDFQSKEWAERDSNEFFRLLKGSTVKGLETVHIGKDGREINLIFNAKFVHDEAGNIIGTRGTAFDMSSFMKVKKDLTESEKKYSKLFDSMNEGVVLHEVVYDTKNVAIDYKIMEANASFERHTGILAEKAKKQLASEFYGSDTAPYLDIYSHVAESGIPTHFETYFPPLDKHFDISVFSPKKQWFATIFTDITERKLAEEKIQKHLDELKKFNASMVDREIKMIHLKKEINEFCKTLNRPEKYSLPEELKSKIGGN